MSLFKARDWWSTVVEGEEGKEEECDLGCLIVANVNNEEPPRDKIIMGGFSGTIRIFLPETHTTEDGSETHGYRPDHVLLESTLNYPITQLAVGRFVSGNDNLHLCVLHPDRLVVYSVTVTTGQAGHGHHTKLTLIYQHVFQRHAHSLVVGPFGGVKGKDFMAVLSLDGCISVFEQESFSFNSFIPGFLVPGPFVYLPKGDTFVMVSADWSLQSYRYQALAVSNTESNNENNKVDGKRLTPEWTNVLGEPAVDLMVINPPGGPCSLMVLTYRAFYCFKESGALKFMKKLEYNPSSFLCYPSESNIFVCVSSHTQTLLVYKETELKWAAQLPFIPVALCRAEFKGIKGGLVLLSDSGQLQLSYLGTDPSLFIAPPTETREINYDQTDKELAQMHRIIKASTKDAGAFLGVGKGDSDLLVTATVGTQLELWGGQTEVQDPDGIPAVPVVIRLTAHTPLNTVRVTIQTEKPLGCTQNTYVLRTICDTSQIMVKFFLAEQYVPCSLDVRIITSYLTGTGAPRILTTELRLPLRLIVKPGSPNKEADHKITLSTNKPAVSLSELFPEFGLDGNTNTALGLEYFGGCDVTVLSSRTTHRYRLQSDRLSALWLIMQELMIRLKKHWQNNVKKNEDELTIGVASSVPLQELFSEIDAHFMRRKKHEDLQLQLVQRATQFRAVQRRLLTKFKDKTPVPLTNLDNLLEGTYKQILQITDAMNDNIKGLEEDGCQLSCVVKLVLEIVRLSVGMNKEQFLLLSSALSPIVHPSLDQGWEEITDSAVTFLIKSVLGRGGGGPASPHLTVPTDTSKLQKHIGVLIDKITRGEAQLTLVSKEEATESQKGFSQKTVLGDDNDDMEEIPSKGDHKIILEAEVPLGSRLGEDRARSARITSARARSARPMPVHPPEMPGNNSEVERSEEGKEETSSVREESDALVEDNDTTRNFDTEEPLEEGKEPEEEGKEPEEEGKEQLAEVMAHIPKNIEELKKETSKDNTIESPEDLFVSPETDDFW